MNGQESRDHKKANNTDAPIEEIPTSIWQFIKQFANLIILSMESFDNNPPYDKKSISDKY
jgi:hypothetical protein